MLPSKLFHRLYSLTDPSAQTLQTYFVGTKSAPPVSTIAAKRLDVADSNQATSEIDVFDLPVPADLQKLTKSQRLFTIATGIDVRSLKIATDTEFFLFMTMRKDRQWASFKMTPPKWVVETKAYNARLGAINAKEKTAAIPKNPRALLEKLLAVETDILERIAKQDFKGASTVRRQSSPQPANTFPS